MPCILTRCRAFLLPRYNTAPYKRLQRVLPRQFILYIAYATKQSTGLYSGFSCDLSHSTAANTRPAQAAIIPLATRWSISQHRSTSTDTRYKTLCRTLYRSVQPPYYNNVYKSARVRPLLWIHARQCNTSQTMPAAAGQRLHLYKVSPAGGRRGTIGGSRRISFRAFARWLIEVSNSRSVPAGIVVANSRKVIR